MRELDGIIDHKIQRALKNVHTTLPCQITEVDLVNGYCSCKILVKVSNGNEFIEHPPLIKVVLDYDISGNTVIRKPRKKNDYVYVTFSETAIDRIIKDGRTQEPISGERFGLNGAFISRGFKLDDDELNHEYLEDLLIENRAAGTIIAIKDNGEVLFKPGNGLFKIDGKLEVTQKINSPTIEAEESLKGAGAEFIGHGHGGVQGGNANTKPFPE